MQGRRPSDCVCLAIPNANTQVLTPPGKRALANTNHYDQRGPIRHQRPTKENHGMRYPSRLHKWCRSPLRERNTTTKALKSSRGTKPRTRCQDTPIELAGGPPVKPHHESHVLPLNLGVITLPNVKNPRMHHRRLEHSHANEQHCNGQSGDLTPFIWSSMSRAH